MLADGDKEHPPGSKELTGIAAAEEVAVEEPPPELVADVADEGAAVTSRLADATADPREITGTADPPDLGEGTANPTKSGTWEPDDEDPPGGEV